jgi:hypothetical protein
VSRTFSIEIPFGTNGEPPTEFRIFRAGVNDSKQGPVLFDDVAASRVMSDYEKHGIAPIIDLEHLSLENPQRSVNYDPDARGDFQLELRAAEKPVAGAKSDLWAVHVTWTADGRERLASRRQRYFSPAFYVESVGEGKPERVVELVNVALCAQPALDRIQPLAASRARSASRNLRTFEAPNMDQDQLAALAEAFDLDPSSSLADIVQAAAAFVKEFEDAVNGEPPPSTGDGDNPAGEESYEADPAAMLRKYAEKFVAKLGAVALVARRAKPNDRALAAFRSTVLRETNATTTEEATDAILTWKKSHLELARETKRIAEERAALEARDKYETVKALARLGYFTPIQAWETDKDGIPQGPNDDKGIEGKLSTFAKRFTLPELKAELKKLGGKAQPGPRGLGDPNAATPPAAGHTSVEVTLADGKKHLVELSEREVDNVKKRVGAKASDEALRGALVKYATLKANTDLKAGKKAS